VNQNMNAIIPQLWVGAEQKDGRGLSDHFQVFVLAAKEIQSGRNYSGLEVWGVPLDDNGVGPTSKEVELAVNAGLAVAERILLGQNVLVTCHLGLNRSSLIAALAMRFLGWDSAATIRKIRAARGRHALSNPGFESLVREV